MEMLNEVLTNPLFVLSLGLYFIVWLYKKYVPHAKETKHWQNRIIPLLSAGLGAVLIYLPHWTGIVSEMGWSVKWVLGIVIGAGGSSWVHSIVSKFVRGQ